MSRPASIIVVEDHDPARVAMGLLLEREGYRVAMYRSVEHAENDIRQNLPDIALLDVRLPGKWGDAFGSELRQLSADMRIIFHHC